MAYPPGVGLQGRLLAGLAVLVFVAIGSAGWLTARVARVELDAAEEERARGMGDAAAALIGRAHDGDGGAEARRARMIAAAGSVVGMAGVRDVAVLDESGKNVVGAAGDPALELTLRGGAELARRDGDLLAVYVPLRAESGARIGAARLRITVGANLDEAVGGSNRLLLWITLFDGALILIFSALFVRSVVGPVGAVSRAAQRVAEGDLDAPPVAGGAGEVGALASSFNRMTAALRDQRARLAASREQVLAQEKLATVGRLAAGVAHEIGNPLTAILGYVEILLADAPKEGLTRESLERVRSETTRIHRIVHDLVEYARPVADVIEPVDLAQVVDAAASLARPQPRFRDVAIERVLDGAPLAAASARRLLQVLLNLLLNAADAMQTGGTIRISTTRDGERVSLDIADSGPGVPPAVRAQIFDPFFTTKEPGSGTGLGLAVCRSILQAYGGGVALVPSEKGACFRVTLPIWPCDGAQGERGGS
ncbi:MAG: sensor histidine kinase [Myxococcales bacterium]|nr:sensor histidine kinase [Myxococcales bacterium]